MSPRIYKQKSSNFNKILFNSPSQHPSTPTHNNATVLMQFIERRKHLDQQHQRLQANSSLLNDSQQLSSGDEKAIAAVILPDASPTAHRTTTTTAANTFAPVQTTTPATGASSLLNPKPVRLRAGSSSSLESSTLSAQSSRLTVSKASAWTGTAKETSSASKTKKLLVEAHEHQLSDITETCKKEMNLLSSLKDSQMVKSVIERVFSVY